MMDAQQTSMRRVTACCQTLMRNAICGSLLSYSQSVFAISFTSSLNVPSISATKAAERNGKTGGRTRRMPRHPSASQASTTPLSFCAVFSSTSAGSCELKSPAAAGASSLEAVGASSLEGQRATVGVHESAGTYADHQSSFGRGSYEWALGQRPSIRHLRPDQSQLMEEGLTTKAHHNGLLRAGA